MAKLILDGDSRGAVRATADLAKGHKEITKAVDENIRRHDEMRRRHKQALAEVATELKKQKLAQDEVTRATRQAQQTEFRAWELKRDMLRRMNAEVKRTKDVQQEAFGAGALSNAVNYFSALFGPAALIHGAISALRNYSDELDNLGSQLQGDRGGLGQLTQLAVAAHPNDPKKQRAMADRLVGEAKSIWQMGATNTLPEAGKFVFALQQAGIDPAQRRIMAEAMAYGVLPEASGTATSIGALRKAFPDLTPAQITGMGIFAGVVSPGATDRLIQDAAASSQNLRKMGWDPAFGLAGTSFLTAAYPQQGDAKTRMQQFTKQLQAFGYQNDPALRGMDPYQALEYIAANTDEGRDYAKLKKFLGGRSEAIQAFDTLYANRNEIRQLHRGTATADGGFLDQAIDLARDTPEISHARQEVASKNKRASSRIGPQSTSSLINSMRDQLVQDQGAFTTFATDFETMLLKMSSEKVQLDKLRDHAADHRLSPDLLEDIRRHLDSIDRKTRGLPPPSGRPE